ncbi:MAG: glycosyltransferase family 4 protein [Methanomassiliicoccus sp.]|nr:glycosyltransferase family 4 protein [Methanomassiliicoccus sp.]
MKILMFTPNYYPNIGGVERHVKSVAENLIKHGDKVTIITKKTDSAALDFEIIEGANVIRVAYKTLPEMWLWILQNIKLIKESDVIHCHDYASFIYWYLPFRFLFRSKRVYITFHGFEGKVPIQTMAILLRSVAEKLTRGNICIGHFIPKWYGTKPTFISYGGVANSFSSREVGVEANDAIYIGRLEKDTGILTYIAALIVLKENYGIDIKLTICGDGSLRDQIEYLVKTNSLKVNLLGFVENPTPYLINSKFAFVSGYLAILEAMSKKKVVISVYDNAIKKDYLTMIPDSNKTMIISSSAEEVASHLQKLIDIDADYARMIEEGYDFAKNHSWDSVMEMYLKLWNDDSL